MIQRANRFAGLVILFFILCAPAFSQQGNEKSENNWYLDQSFGFPVWTAVNKLIGSPDYPDRRIYLFIDKQNFSEQNVKKVFIAFAARYRTPHDLIIDAYSSKAVVEWEKSDSYGGFSGSFEDSLQGKRSARNSSVSNKFFRSGCYRARYFRLGGDQERIEYSPDPEREYIKKIDLKHPGVTYSGDLQKDLLTAIEQEDLKKVNALVETGVDVNQANAYGNTPLMKAAANGNAEMVRLFLDKGADVKLCDKAGINALLLASIDGATSVVEMLLDNGADIDTGVDIKQSELGDTALMAAALRGHVKTVQVLVARGANVNTRNRVEETALMQAAAGGALDTVQLLLACGADVNARDIDGLTSLMFALSKPEIVKALLDASVDFTIRNKDGMTVLMLMIASRYSYEKSIQVLIEKGAGKESIAQCKALIASSPTQNSPQWHLQKDTLYRTLTEIYQQLGLKKEAIETSQQAIIDLGDKPYLRFRLGYTYLEASDRKGAIKQYRILQKRYMNAADADTRRLYFGWTEALFKALQRKD